LISNKKKTRRRNWSFDRNSCLLLFSWSSTKKKTKKKKKRKFSRL